MVLAWGSSSRRGLCDQRYCVSDASSRTKAILFRSRSLDRNCSWDIAVKGMLEGGYGERVHWRTTVGIKEALAAKIQYLGHLCEPSAVFTQPSSESWLALVCTYPIQNGGITWSTGKSAAPNLCEWNIWHDDRRAGSRADMVRHRGMG